MSGPRLHRPTQGCRIMGVCVCVRGPGAPLMGLDTRGVPTGASSEGTQKPVDEEVGAVG